MHAAADVQAAATLLRLLAAACPRVVPTLEAGEPGRPAWGEHGIIVGPHHLAYQVLDGCAPRLASVRPSASVRLLGSGTVFEAREGLDFGLIYKGDRTGVRRSYLLVTGLGDAGTIAAAEFLARHAAGLGRLVGAARVCPGGGGPPGAGPGERDAAGGSSRAPPGGAGCSMGRTGRRSARRRPRFRPPVPGGSPGAAGGGGADPTRAPGGGGAGGRGGAED
ncbi:MAG: hypothetical protein IPG75_15035 [Gemmatimonadetes bacterium]|nr:hypothetical protein [Gemmatimonadota bacterium]